MLQHKTDLTPGLHKRKRLTQYQYLNLCSKGGITQVNTYACGRWAYIKQAALRSFHFVCICF